MRSSNPPLQEFVEDVGLELVRICIDKFGSEDFLWICGESCRLIDLGV